MELQARHVELIAKVVTSDNSGAIAVGYETVELEDLRIALRAALPVLERQLKGELRRAEKRAANARSHQLWSRDEEEKIWQMRREGVDIEAIARAVGRHVDAVRRRFEQTAFRDGNPRKGRGNHDDDRIGSSRTP